MESKYNLLTRLLNNIKNVVTPDGNVAGSGGVLVVHDVDGTLDKTWQEIFDAMLSGGAVIQIGETVANNVLRVFVSKEEYAVHTSVLGDYVTSSASGYPTFESDGID